MRPWLIGSVLSSVVLVGGVLLAGPAQAGTTTEVLVSSTAPTALPASPLRRGLLIENQGPNPIWCALTAASAVIGKSHRIGPASERPGNRFPFNNPDTWYCIAETATQVSGAATVVSEVI